MIKFSESIKMGDGVWKGFTKKIDPANLQSLRSMVNAALNDQAEFNKLVSLLLSRDPMVCLWAMTEILENGADEVCQKLFGDKDLTKHWQAYWRSPQYEATHVEREYAKKLNDRMPK
jgi:hypothetical protein